MLAHVSEQLVNKPAHERPRRVNAGNQLGNHLQPHTLYEWQYSKFINNVGKDDVTPAGSYLQSSLELA